MSRASLTIVQAFATLLSALGIVENLRGLSSNVANYQTIGVYPSRPHPPHLLRVEQAIASDDGSTRGATPYPATPRHMLFAPPMTPLIGSPSAPWPRFPPLCPRVFARQAHANTQVPLAPTRRLMTRCTTTALLVVVDMDQSAARTIATFLRSTPRATTSALTCSPFVPIPLAPICPLLPIDSKVLCVPHPAFQGPTLRPPSGV